MTDRRIDVERAHDARTLIVLDAHQTLDLFMDGDMPDASRFEASIGRLIADLLCENNERLLVRAYGEMVDVLWQQGRSEDAMGNFYRPSPARVECIDAFRLKSMGTDFRHKVSPEAAKSTCMAVPHYRALCQ